MYYKLIESSTHICISIYIYIDILIITVSHVGFIVNMYTWRINKIAISPFNATQVCKIVKVINKR